MKGEQRRERRKKMGSRGRMIKLGLKNKAHQNPII
jgi:hypothetical protein